MVNILGTGWEPRSAEVRCTVILAAKKEKIVVALSWANNTVQRPKATVIILHYRNIFLLKEKLYLLFACFPGPLVTSAKPTKVGFPCPEVLSAKITGKSSFMSELYLLLVSRNASWQPSFLQNAPTCLPQSCKAHMVHCSKNACSIACRSHEVLFHVLVK